MLITQKNLVLKNLVLQITFEMKSLIATIIIFIKHILYYENAFFVADLLELKEDDILEMGR